MVLSPSNPATNADSAPPDDLTSIGATLRPIFRRTWLWLVVVGVISVGVGIAATMILAKDRFVFSGTLLFNESYLGSPVYRSPDVFSLATLMKSPQTLNKLREEFQLAVPLTLLERRILVEARHGSANVVVQLEWESREDAEKMLNRLMEITVERSREFRDTRLKQYIAMFTEDLGKSEHRFDQVRNEMLTLYRDEHTLDLDEHLRSLSSSLKTLTNELAFANAKRAGTHKSLAKVREMMASDDQKVDPAVEANAQNDENAKNFARAQINKTRLEEQIKEYQTQASTNVLLTAKRRDLERARQLFARKFITATELEQLESEVQLLEIQLRDDSQLKIWKAQLEEITRELESSAGTSLALAGMASNNLMLREAELEAALEVDDEVIARLTKDVEERRQEMTRLLKLRPKGLQLDESLEDAQRIRDDVGRQLTDFNLLERSDAGIFTVMEKAAPAVIPVLSNKKKILAAVTGAAFFGMAGPILLWDFLRQSKRGLLTNGTGRSRDGALFGETGLPQYAGRSIGTIQAMTRAITAAADHKGFSVVFAGVSKKPIPQDVILRCASELSSQGEPVLLVDPGYDPQLTRDFAALVGGANNSSSQTQDTSPVSIVGDAPVDRSDSAEILQRARRTTIDQVDLLTLDSTTVTWSKLAEQFPRLADRYAFLLIAGPSRAARRQVERLMEDCDALLLTTDSSSLGRHGWKLLEQCRESGRHVLGVAIRRSSDQDGTL